MLVLLSLHHYVAILHGGGLSCPLTLLEGEGGVISVCVRSVNVLARSHLCSLIKPLRCSPPSRGNTQW